IPDPAPHWPQARQLFEIGVSVVVLFVYASLLPAVGFIIATAFAAAYLTWRLGSTPVQSVIIGIGTSIGIFVVFKLILGLSLAEGPLGF
ncbi:MAG TPA: tripartite tricarboxylate transporter TctB family protein, partial [Paracoccaceae bacterium]